MTAKEQVKMLLLKRNMTITGLALKMSEFYERQYSRQNLSNKLSNGTLRFEEFELIAKILSYRIELVDEEPEL